MDLQTHLAHLIQDYNGVWGIHWLPLTCGMSVHMHGKGVANKHTHKSTYTYTQTHTTRMLLEGRTMREGRSMRPIDTMGQVNRKYSVQAEGGLGCLYNAQPHKCAC